MWEELKDRKVVRVGALYAAVAWGVVLGGAELSDILELPSWVPKLILVLAVLGFPVALVLAWAFEVTPEGVRRTAPLSSPSSNRPSRKPFIAGVVAGIASISLVAFLVSEGPEAPAPGAGGLDPDLVAVLPFRYSGPQELDYLGDGVFQLLASRFTGEVGPRAADPTATASVWDQVSEVTPTMAAEVVATRLGAGLVLTGGVVAGPDGLNLSATLRDVADDEEVATASAQGPADSLAAVVERLAGGLLSLSMGEYPESLAQLTSADPAALREYLQGQLEFRNGRWFEAYDHFSRAVEIDSTFALASVWMADAGNNVPGAATEEALERAWRHRERLSDRDRLYLEARLGPNYPEPATMEERRRAYREAARLAPDRANIWYFLGESTVHRPTSSESYDQALRYFARAHELDPRNANVLLHLQIAHLLRGDEEGLLAAVDRMAAIDTTRATQQMARWMEAAVTGDSAATVLLYEEMDLEVSPALIFMDAPVLFRGDWQVEPLTEALERFHDELIPGSSNSSFYYVLYYGFQDLGRPARASAILAEHERATEDPRHVMRLLDAVYGALPEEEGREAARAIEELLAGEDEWSLFAVLHRTALEIWRVSRDDLSTVDGTVQLYRELQAGRPSAERKSLQTQALLLEAMAALRRDRGDVALGAIDAMDALFLEGPPGLRTDLYDAMVLATAEVYEELGDADKALLVLERESNFDNFRWPFGARFARERGRLAALTGDTARAVDEYTFYLRMRADPEPELEEEVEDVRAALELLQRR